MYIVWGSRLMGKCDTVPGLGHVETRFGHLYYLPLIPSQTFLVLSKSGKNFRGVPLSLSFKSILMAWSRAILTVAGLVLAIVTLAFSLDPKVKESPIVPGVVAAICWIAAAILSYAKPFTHASFARAYELAKQCKLSAAGMEAIAKHYGQPLPRGFEGIKPAPPKVPQVATSRQAPSPAKAPLIPVDEPIPLEPVPSRGNAQEIGLT